MSIPVYKHISSVTQLMHTDMKIYGRCDGRVSPMLPGNASDVGSRNIKQWQAPGLEGFFFSPPSLYFVPLLEAS